MNRAERRRQQKLANLTDRAERPAYLRALDAVAVRRGTAGASDRQREEHRKQREQYIAWLKQLKRLKS
jgi:hypothetical protein